MNREDIIRMAREAGFDPLAGGRLLKQKRIKTMDILDTRPNLNATVLCHEQQIKDLAEHLLELKQLLTLTMEFKKEKKEWVSLTYEEVSQIIEMGLGVRDSIDTALEKLQDKNSC
jgi:hypothetical protein